MFFPAFGSKKHIEAIMQKTISILFSKKEQELTQS